MYGSRVYNSAMPKPKNTTGCQIEQCGRQVAAWGMCKKHYHRWHRYGDATFVTVRTAKPGADGYIKIMVNGKGMLQHRHFMEVHLGRTLLPEENVHHINGNRADNRIDNLEVWNTRQPKGQRIPDKIKYALEILELYAPHLLNKENSNG